MVSKKFLSVMTAVFLLTGVGGTSIAKTFNPAVPNQVSSIEQGLESLGGPTDLSIANEEKIIEMLKKEEKIPKNATYEEAQKIYLKYMQDSAKANEKIPVTKLERELRAKENQRAQKYKFDPSQQDNNPKEVNILTLLVDYADYKNNQIQPGETSMYYAKYDKEHFEEMIFGDNGYKGPNGENFVSMKQFYEEQSGGSLKVKGKVAGWYTLPGTAASYGAQSGNSNDINARLAVRNALALAAKDPNINFVDFDKEDRYDDDGDGNYNEPDGVIDHLMVIHAGVGQEAGGGSLKSDAIWSHRWNLGNYYGYKDTFGNILYALDYTIEPEDGAAGVFAHEFCHDLGAPDEYDINYTSTAGEPIAMWSLMSSGSWAGKIQGTEPSGISPYTREKLQGLYGGNWQKQITVDYNEISKAGVRVNLRQASEEGQAVRINLPDKKGNLIAKPFGGSYSYYSGQGNGLNNSMITSLNLTEVNAPKLTFKAWYEIEEGWDYASVQVKNELGNWVTVEGDITTEDNPYDQNPGHGITGTSNGWIDAEFDLSQYAGKTIDLRFNYWTDGAEAPNGLLIDDIAVKSGDTTVLSDNAEGISKFTFEGFEKNDGYLYTARYYLVEWRNHDGVDTGLSHIAAAGQIYSYDPGMVVWYVDKSYTERDNETGKHPGEGYLGVVDADQNNLQWKYSDANIKPFYASGRYQMHDAAFSKNKEADMSVLNVKEYDKFGVYVGTRGTTDTYSFTEPNFSDSTNYLNPQISPLGRNIPKLGINIQITNQANDNSSASITIMKK
jgi:immune inhibitor A